MSQQFNNINELPTELQESLVRMLIQYNRLSGYDYNPNLSPEQNFVEALEHCDENAYNRGVESTNLFAGTW